MNKNLVLGLVVAGIVVLGLLFFGDLVVTRNTQQFTPVSRPSLANPASVNCAKKGGTTEVVNGPNGQYGLCNFEDDYACEEWALFRGECPVGGVRTTGFDSDAQKYCAWVGGQTLAVPDAQCTLPNGKVCSDETLYDGSCFQN